VILTIVFISFGLFKIRNQAKEKRLTVRKSKEKKILPMDVNKAEELNIEQQEFHTEEKYVTDEKNIDNEKFVVINEYIKSSFSNSSRTTFMQRLQTMFLICNVFSTIIFFILT